MKLSYWPTMLLIFLMFGACEKDIDIIVKTKNSSHNGMTLSQMEEKLTVLFSKDREIDDDCRMLFYRARIIGNIQLYKTGSVFDLSRTKGLRDWGPESIARYGAERQRRETLEKEFIIWGARIINAGKFREGFTDKTHNWLFRVKLASDFLFNAGKFKITVIRKIEKLLAIEIIPARK